MAGIFDIFKDFEGTRRKYLEQFAGLKSTESASPTGKEWSTTVPVSLFYRMYDKPYAVGDIQLDLILSESHSLTSTVSEHPVEEGATISDHIQQNLRVGKLTGLVSNFSIQTGGGDGATNRAMNAWTLFHNLWKRRELVTIVTTLEVYENVAVTNVSTERSSTSGDALQFEVSFQEVRQPKLQEVTLAATVQPPKMNTKQQRQASNKVRNGRATGKAATLDLGETKIVGRTTL